MSVLKQTDGDYNYNLKSRGVQFGDTQPKKRSSGAHPCPYDPELNELCWDPNRPKGSLPPDNGCLLRWNGKVWDEIWCRTSSTNDGLRFVIISTPPRQIDFTTGGDPIPTDTITAQLRIIGDNPDTEAVETDYVLVADHDTTVYLYTSSPDGFFEKFDVGSSSWVTVTTVTIAEGASTSSFRYTDTNGGNPVIEVSLVELA